MSLMKRKVKSALPRYPRRPITVAQSLDRLALAAEMRDSMIAAVLYRVSELPLIDKTKPVVDAGTVLYDVLFDACKAELEKRR